MRYILDNNGYIEAIAFGSAIICNNNSCTEYVGTIPDGYSSLTEWAENANIRAYKIVSNNLIYDSAKDAELQAQWATEGEYAISNTPGHNGGTNNIKLVQVGQIIILNVSALWIDSISKDTWIKLGDIPTKLIPTTFKSGVAIACRGTDGNVIGMGKVEVTDTGKLQFKGNISYDQLSALNFNLMWTL